MRLLRFDSKGPADRTRRPQRDARADPRLRAAQRNLERLYRSERAATFDVFEDMLRQSVRRLDAERR